MRSPTCSECGAPIDCAACGARTQRMVSEAMAVKNSAAKIIAVVSKHTRVPVAAILSAIRDDTTVNARYLAIWLCRQNLQLSEPKLAEVFKRDHSTIDYALKRMARRLTVQPQLLREVNRMRRGLSNGASPNL